MERNLDEVAISQRKMLNRLGKRKGETYPLTLMETYKKQIKKAKKWMSTRDYIKVLYINHRDVIHQPFESALKINDFLDNHLDPQKMAAIVDPSLYREKSNIST